MKKPNAFSIAQELVGDDVTKKDADKVYNRESGNKPDSQTDSPKEQEPATKEVTKEKTSTKPKEQEPATKEVTKEKKPTEEKVSQESGSSAKPIQSTSTESKKGEWITVRVNKRHKKIIELLNMFGELKGVKNETEVLAYIIDYFAERKAYKEMLEPFKKHLDSIT